MEEKEVTAFMAHFPKADSADLMNYIINDRLKSSRYLFVKTVKGIQAAYCTHCNQQFLTSERLRQTKDKKRVFCEKCGSACVVKAHGRVRKHLRDRAQFIFYDKSLINSDCIVAREVYVERHYAGDYTKVEWNVSISSYYLFQPGKKGMCVSRRWSAKSGLGQIENIVTRHSSICLDSIRSAVQGTPYQYSTYERYQNDDMLVFFDRYSQYPCIEYLTKLGLGYFVRAFLYKRNPTFGAIKWSGKTIHDVLKLSKQDAKVFMDLRKSAEISPAMLYLFQQARKQKSDMTLEELNRIAWLLQSYPAKFKSVLKRMTIRRMYNYLHKQIAMRKTNATLAAVLMDWYDYIQECTILEYNLKDDRVLFPTNLVKAHDKTMVLIEIKKTADIEKKFNVRKQSLAKYSYSDDSYLIRPIDSVDELIREGRVLEHCVGSYADSYAKGTASLMVMRSQAAPQKPLYTIEINLTQKRIVQAQGKKRIHPSNEAEQFLEQFKALKLK